MNLEIFSFIVLVIMSFLSWLPMTYMCCQMKRIKKNEEYRDDDYDDDYDDEEYETIIRTYKAAVKDIQKEFDRLDSSIENQRKIVNGWQHKICIMDEEIRKLKSKE